MVEVVAALIWDQNKFMICQRPANKARGLLWEFVGGKVEPDETKEQALIRECQEELAIKLDVGNVFMDVVHEYDYMSGLIQEYLDHGYQYSELIQEKPDVGFKGLRMYEMRYYVFCTSLDNDLLNMWNYYVKGGNYQGYNIGISVKDIINSFSNITDEKVNIYFGPIIYTDREKIELLKRIILDIDQKLSRALEKITDIQERGITTDIHYGELLSYIHRQRRPSAKKDKKYENIFY